MDRTAVDPARRRTTRPWAAAHNPSKVGVVYCWGNPLKVFLMSVIAILVITIVAQYTVTHYAGESSEAAYSDRSTRP